ncbi:hypothetical protein GGR08_001571 [Bartonella fuyuanensis]|uniref:Uncharacterized protein n=1 Tax=Bartonella fuyuanensis TaxID=1460968 RepID=A0A840DZX9_9HYPH|nr:hypothetical protein [Bartonella fuyuanensis]
MMTIAGCMMMLMSMVMRGCMTMQKYGIILKFCDQIYSNAKLNKKH